MLVGEGQRAAAGAQKLTATMNRMPRLRVSAISYLNTAPLMWSFEHGCERDELRQRFQVDYTIPSRCAQMLADASADIGIIPVAAYTTIENLQILPDVAIASDDAVRSILLVSKVPLEKIGTVEDRKSTRLNSSHMSISYAVFCLKKKKK